jgi:antitoxin VapB
MALSIKDPETDALVRRLAKLKKTSFTGAIRLAVNNELNLSEKRRGPTPEFWAKLRQLQDEVAALPVLDSRTPDEIMGYDEHGLPN